MAGILLVAACSSGPPVYRAHIQLVYSESGAPVPSNDASHEGDRNFYETQSRIICSREILQRAQRRMGATTVDMKRELVRLTSTRPGDSNILQISVEARSPEFTKRLTDTIASEYLMLCYERMNQIETAAINRDLGELKRLGDELAVLDEKLETIAKARNVSPDAVLAEVPGLREKRVGLQKQYDLLKLEIQQLTITEPSSPRRVNYGKPAVLESAPAR